MTKPESSQGSPGFSGKALEDRPVTQKLQTNLVVLRGTTEAEQLSQILSAVYDAALDSERWPEALQLATIFLGGIAANLFWQDPVNNQAAVFHDWGDNPSYVQLYFERYAALNPYFPAISFVPTGVVFSGGDIIPHEDFAQTQFYQEWVAPQGFIDVIGVNLHRFALGVAAFSVRRSRAQGFVDDEMRRKMELLAPHLQRAVMIGREFDGIRSKCVSLEAVLDLVTAAVFLVDAAGKLELANATGLALLKQGDMLGRREGVLAASDRTADKTLRAAYALSGTGDDHAMKACPPSIVLTNKQRERYLVHVLPLSSGARQTGSLGDRAQAAVFVRKTEVPITSGIEVLAKLHGLTASEARVLQAAVALGSVAEIASSLGVGVATVKTHLASLFAKTGTHRRSELVSAVAAHGNPLL
ncbi:LuxR C-terminal-related transcriptional regulator [Methylobacterium sp. J-048]|uniref:response regulator transcription factor n=1 Tax=Methylobacterium sp. J-048 TaxID=2836635 RepID=UPI001FB9D0C1|nr:LuxR C-terminal-related transcriptional regulator [Methylobacterium sp. J-048]MCJ2058184.1 LuxR C-terminal-related transcriptional regulator [Methylobacterium sp. J-048]